jgi:hypothetical protein
VSAQYSKGVNSGYLKRDLKQNLKQGLKRDPTLNWT